MTTKDERILNGAGLATVWKEVKDRDQIATEDIAELNTKVSSLTTSLNAKADASTVSTLSTAVAANTSSISDLNTAVATKANKSDIPDEYTLPVATTSTLGGVKPSTDGSSMAGYIKADSNGILTLSHLTDGAVSTNKVADKAITAAKIADGVIPSLSDYAKTADVTSADSATLASAKAYTDEAIPTKVSELDNDVPYLFDVLGGKEWVQSNVTGVSFRTIFSDGNIWVAGSYNQGLYYSADGKNWTQSNITAGGVHSIYNDGYIWVAANYDSNLLYSTDGKTWNSQDRLPLFPTCVYADGNVWVATTEYGIYCSTDGKNWFESNIDSEIGFHSVYSDGSTWVAGSYACGLFYSIDGEVWTQSNVTLYDFYSIYSDGTIWVAGSSDGIYYSTDGKTWTQSNITSDSVFSVYGDGTIWVAGSRGEKGCYYSTDGKTWTQSNITSDSVFSVYGDGTIWVASPFGNGLYYSTDGKTWTQSNVTSCYFGPVYSDGSIWVAGSYSDEGFYYSESIDYIDRKELNEALATASGGATRHVIECGEFGVTMSDDAKAGLEELTAAFIADKVAGCEIYFGENTRYYLAKVTPRVVSDVSYLGLNFASTGSGEERFTMVDMSISWNSDGNLFTGSQHQLLFTGNEAFSHNDRSLDGYDTTIVWWS